MRTEPVEIKANKARRQPIDREANNRQLQVHTLSSETVDEAFATLSEGFIRTDPPESLNSGNKLDASPADLLQENQAIVSDIARQLRALEGQRRKLAELFEEMKKLS